MGIAADMNPSLRMHEAITQQHRHCLHSNKHREGWNNFWGNCGGVICVGISEGTGITATG